MQKGSKALSYLMPAKSSVTGEIGPGRKVSNNTNRINAAQRCSPIDFLFLMHCLLGGRLQAENYFFMPRKESPITMKQTRNKTQTNNYTIGNNLDLKLTCLVRQKCDNYAD